MSELGYDSAGAGDPALLFLHGWCCDRSFFAPQFDLFSKTHRVVSVDLAGHGKSDVPANYAIDALASDVAELAAELGLGRSVVLGHSLGALIALALWQQSPELVAAIVMVEPPPLSKEVWDGFSAQLIPSLEGPDGRAGRRRFVEQLFLPTDDEARRTQILETMDSVPIDAAILMLQAISDFDAVAPVRACDVPLLTISSAMPMNDTASLLAASPMMTVGQIVGAGHFPQLEVPEQVNPMIERFLTVIRSGSLTLS